MLRVACPQCKTPHLVPAVRPARGPFRTAASTALTVRCLQCGRDFVAPAAAVSRPAAKATPPAVWTQSELGRRAAVEAGGTVLVNQAYDKALIAWATRHGVFVKVDRSTAWGSPFTPTVDGTGPQVAELYRAYLAGEPGLLARLPALRGKALGCWCYPSACHADVLLELIASLEDTLQ